MGQSRTNFNKKVQLEEAEVSEKSRIIEEDTIFKCAMTRDYKNIHELSIVSE